MEIKGMHLHDLLKSETHIPVYQRDYAQGRNTVQAQDVRKSFVEALYKVARSATEELSLDLVFTAASQLVDGQQRLTTLLLFYLYHQAEGVCFKNLKYDGRKEVEAFWNNLIDKWSEIKNHVNNLKDDTPVTRYVTEQMWFHLAWKNEPTIMGMLRTLDEIHKQSEVPELPPKWEECFTFIQCDEKEAIGDEKNALSRYAAMNARGKMLTNFENLKAYLESKKFEDKKLLTDEGWCYPIDTAWLEKLWNLWKEKEGGVVKNDTIGACDSVLLRLTLSLLLLYYAKCKTQQGEANESVEQIVAALHQMAEGKAMSYSIVDEALQEGWNVYLMTWMACLFDNWSRTENRMKFAWSEDKWSPLKALNYKDLALLYAYVCGKDKGDDWFATVHNMIENVRSPIDKAKSLLNAIEWIEKAVNDVDEALRSEVELKDPNKGFAAQQAEEEIKKRDLIATSGNGDKWRTHIRDAEKLSWLKGRIDFLLHETVTPSDSGDFEKNLLVCKEKMKKENRSEWLSYILCHLAEENEKEKKGEKFVPWDELSCALEDAQLKAFIYSNVELQHALLHWTKSMDLWSKKPSLWEQHLGKIKDWTNRKLHRGGYDGTSVWLYKNSNARNALRIDSQVDWWFETIDYIAETEKEPSRTATSNWEVQGTSSGPWLKVYYKDREVAFGSNGTIQIWVKNANCKGGGDWCPNKELPLNNGEPELKLASKAGEDVKELMEGLIRKKWCSTGSDVNWQDEPGATVEEILQKHRGGIMREDALEEV